MAIRSALSNARDCLAPEAASRFLFVKDRVKALRYCKRDVKEANEILDMIEILYRYLDGLETKDSLVEKGELLWMLLEAKKELDDLCTNIRIVDSDDVHIPYPYMLQGLFKIGEKTKAFSIGFHKHRFTEALQNAKQHLKDYHATVTKENL